MAPTLDTVKIIYKGVNISNDISDLLQEFEYSDKTDGECDEISLTLDNSDLRWFNEWHPIKGDKIEAEIHTAAGEVLTCGIFEVANPSASGGKDGGHLFTLKATAAGVTDPIRTKRTVAHEGKTLRQIVNKIADKHGYSVIGITKDFTIRYESQFQETDLGFLHRLAVQYGYIFSVRGKKLVFVEMKDLHTANAVHIITFNSAGSYELDEQLTRVYKKANVKSRNKRKKSLQQMAKDYGLTIPGDTLNVKANIDNDQQGEIVADAILYRKNLDQVSITVNDLAGNLYLVAGNNVNFVGWGVYDGKYTLSASNHVWNKSGGYKVASITCKKIRA